MNWSPPSWADRFLRWFCKSQYLEEIQGDLHEIFYNKTKDRGLRYARTTYLLDVLKFFRWSNFNLKINPPPIIMFQSYLKTGLRNFIRNKVTSAINVVGLATSISIGIAVYLIIDKQLRLDEFHPEVEKIFTVQSVIAWEGQQETWAKTPQMLGQVLLEDFPQVEYAARVRVKSSLVRYKEMLFAEPLTFVDQDYFEIFDFPLIAGSHRLGLNQVIISRNTALKYFKDEDPLGKTLRIIVNEQPHLFQVSAVAQKFPQTASFDFDFAVSIDHLPAMVPTDLTSWRNVNDEALFTFIKLNEPQSIEGIKSKMSTYLEEINNANTDWPIESFRFEPLSTAAENSQFTRSCYACGSTPQVLVMFAFISLLLFASACFNYINIAVASSGKRLKEIALRKVIGSTRRQVILQFLVENTVMTFVAVATGLVLAKALILPGVQSIFGGELLEMNLLQDFRLIRFIVGSFIFISICSGAYPAWYISSFEPNVIFRGRERFGRKNWLTKLFLTTQFFLTFSAITAGFVFTQANEQQKEQPWGYNPDDILVVPISRPAHYEVLNQYARQSSDISRYCTSGAQIGRLAKSEVAETLAEKSTVDAFYVDESFLELMELPFVAGSGFDPDQTANLKKSVLINETLAKVFQTQLYDEITLNNEDFTVIGITQDFHHRDFFEPIKPAVFKLSNKESARYFSLKTLPNGVDKVNAEIAALWKKEFPDELYVSRVQAYVFDRFFSQSGMLIDVMNFTAVVAILISGMGLFGLISLLIVTRMKELSIRNVLGCTRKESAMLIVRQFYWMIGISIVLGSIANYKAFELLFDQVFQGSEIHLGLTPYVFATAIILGTLVLAVFYHLKQLLSSNPMVNLRTE
ncbi:MAG: ABC transporter permease [Bacteroidota bacterium]